MSVTGRLGPISSSWSSTSLIFWLTSFTMLGRWVLMCEKRSYVSMRVSDSMPSTPCGSEL